MGYLAPGLVDAYVGNRLREKRETLGLDLEQFSLVVNIPPKTIDRYERGIVRIGAAKMYDISKSLDIRIAYFYEGFAVGDDMTFTPKSVTTEFLTT
jgi:transcriptional regulator with XRE-family HTH domain